MTSKRDVDKHFPRNGPCMFHPTRYARHRLIDNIRGRYRAGDGVTLLAQDFDLPVAAVRAAISSRPDDNRMTPREMREAIRARSTKD